MTITLVRLNKESQLKTDLNSGIISLMDSHEDHLRPHLCLNGEEGLKVFQKIAEDPKTAKTEISVNDHLILNGSDAWLNICFAVFVDRITTNSLLSLSPRQTIHVIKNLPSESQLKVIKKIKTYFFEEFIFDLKQAIEKIRRQFEDDDLFREDAYRNQIFDIHDRDSLDNVSCTEQRIIGDKLFSPFFFGATLFDDQDAGYERVDLFLENVDRKRKRAAYGFADLLRVMK